MERNFTGNLLNPNQTLALQVQFKPTATGAVTGKLTVSNNSTTGIRPRWPPERDGHGRSESKVDAERVEPELWQRDGEYNEDAIVDRFDQDVGGKGAARHAISGTGFTIVGGTLPATLNPNQTLALQVQFKPTATGAVTREAYRSAATRPRVRRPRWRSERYGHGRGESKVDAERVEPELWQRDGEYSEDDDVETDLLRDVGGKGAARMRFRVRAFTIVGNFTGDAEPEVRRWRCRYSSIRPRQEP